MPVKKKLLSSILYLINAFYFLTLIFFLIFHETPAKDDWLKTLQRAFLNTEYKDILTIGIINILFNFIFIAFIFLLSGKNKATDIILFTIAWSAGLIAYLLTPNLTEQYLVAAGAFTLIFFNRFTLQASTKKTSV